MTASELDAARFATRRAVVRGTELAYVREGEGGVPLLLVHGWPDSKRIWWRVIEPLGRSGFDVIAPDLRGFGESGLGADGWHDVPAFSRDLHALVHDELGLDRIVGAAGDLGSRVIQDLALRFDGFIERMALWNGPLPLVPGMASLRHQPASVALDYHVRQGTDADGLAAELDTADKRRRYVATMYTSRWWAHPDSFTAEAVAFQTEPYGDAARFRAALGHYESVHLPHRRSEAALMAPSDLRTLVLFGAADHVVPPDYDRMAPHAFGNLVGPFVLRDAGHWPQWEAADLFTSAITTFSSDRLAGAHAPSTPSLSTIER
jgi:pimeloyl-ACP methyl ester carboxylesterase